jgi:hypothetical protein
MYQAASKAFSLIAGISNKTNCSIKYFNEKRLSSGIVLHFESLDTTKAIYSRVS